MRLSLDQTEMECSRVDKQQINEPKSQERTTYGPGSFKLLRLFYWFVGPTSLKSRSISVLGVDKQ